MALQHAAGNRILTWCGKASSWQERRMQIDMRLGRPPEGPSDVHSTALHESPRKRIHVCFVAPAAWPILVRDTRLRVVGGAEVQQCIIARALASSGHRVSMVCMDYGQPDGAIVDNVRVHKTFKPG